MELDLWNNLVYVVFGNIYIFLGVLALMFSWSALIYDIPKWVGISFFGLMLAWIAVVEGVYGLLAIILISTAFFVAIQIMKRARN